jgi:glycosyltransferase involved in cell wall biosynthesis
MAWRPGKKRVFMALGGRAALERTSAFHATTVGEARDIHRLFPETPTGIVPNGVEIPSETELQQLAAPIGTPSLLYLGRLHPHKNVDLLLRVWGKVAPSIPGSTAVFAGPGEPSVVERLLRLASELGVKDRTSFPGMVSGEQKGRLLAGAGVLALPSKSENFGNVVAEALAYGTPVIASTGTPWEELGANGCGWWVDADEETLAGALSRALSMTCERRSAMGRAGREWMAREYSWASVAGRMRDFYEGVLSGRQNQIH